MCCSALRIAQSSFLIEFSSGHSGLTCPFFPQQKHVLSLPPCVKLILLVFWVEEVEAVLSSSFLGLDHLFCLDFPYYHVNGCSVCLSQRYMSSGTGCSALRTATQVHSVENHICLGRYYGSTSMPSTCLMLRPLCLALK